MKSRILCLALLLAVGGISACSKMAHWQTYTYDDYRLSIDSPYALIPAALDNDPKTNAEMQRQIFLQNKEGQDSGFVLSVTSFALRHNLPLASLGKLADNSADAMKTVAGVSNFNWTHRPYEWKGMVGQMNEGSYDIAGTTIAFQMVTFLKDNWMWQVNAQCAKADANQKKMADKVLQSINIKP